MDSYAYEYVITALENRLFEDSELREILQMYIDDQDLIQSLLDYRKCDFSHAAPISSENATQNTTTSQHTIPTLTCDETTITIDKDVKKYIVKKFDLINTGVPQSKELVLPAYLRSPQPSKKSNKKKRKN